MSILISTLSYGEFKIFRELNILVRANLDKIKEYRDIQDPRDIISEAEYKSGGKYNYFKDTI